MRLEARREQPACRRSRCAISCATTLRLRPDRILLGEVRGGEAFDLLQALNTGHAGSLSTLHANSAEQALSRFTNCVLQSGIELPYAAIRANIAEVVSLLVHIERRHGQRFVSEVLQVKGYVAKDDRYELLGTFRKE